MSDFIYESVASDSVRAGRLVKLDVPQSLDRNLPPPDPIELPGPTLPELGPWHEAVKEVLGLPPNYMSSTGIR